MSTMHIQRIETFTLKQSAVRETASLTLARPPERSSMSPIRHSRPDRSARPFAIDPLEPRLLFASFGFQTARTVSAGVRPATLAVADFNSDGFPDIAAGNTGGTGGVSILLGNGNGTYHAGGSVI